MTVPPTLLERDTGGDRLEMLFAAVQGGLMLELSDMVGCPDLIRFRGKSGKHVLASRFSGFDRRRIRNAKLLAVQLILNPISRAANPCCNLPS